MTSYGSIVALTTVADGITSREYVKATARNGSRYSARLASCPIGKVRPGADVRCRLKSSIEHLFVNLTVAMSIRLFLSAFVFVAPVSAFASEGMIYGFVYECDAEKINRNMVEMCSGQFPNLSTQANDAFAAWRDRNFAKANAAKKACSPFLSDKSKNASANDRRAVSKLNADAQAEMHFSFHAKVRKEGAAACLEAFNQLKTVGGPLDIR